MQIFIYILIGFIAGKYLLPLADEISILLLLQVQSWQAKVQIKASLRHREFQDEVEREKTIGKKIGFDCYDE